MAAIGYAIGRLEGQRGSVRREALLVVVLLPLMLAVRNALAPLPVQLLVGLALLAVADLVPVRPRSASTAERRL
jgi:hypothetical protein